MRADIAQALWELGFTPKVFTKPDGDRKSKAVDIAFTTDVLSHAYQDNYDAAFLIAGDEDYVPLIDELKHHGRVVIVGFLSGEESGLSPKLRLAADAFPISPTSLAIRFVTRQRRTAAESASAVLRDVLVD
jgi:uncharacterized LabA/DUF88 family protein